VWRDLLEECYRAVCTGSSGLMRSQALKARPRRRRLPPDAGERQAGAAVAPNVLNRKWIADFTYVWTAEGWLCVAAVIDRFSRRVVGWSECRDDRAARDGCPSDNDLAPRQARCAAESLRSRKPAHHGAVPGLLADNGVVCSMSRSGNVWDNAAMESFFSSLKTDRTDNKTYRTRTKPGSMCSITSSASITLSEGTRRSGI
jgi:putative transposase